MENHWIKGVNVTPYGVYIECAKEQEDDIEREAEGLIECMSCCGEKLKCEPDEKPEPLASAHAVPMTDNLVEELLKKIFDTVDETPIAKMPVSDDDETMARDQCRHCQNMVSVAFSGRWTDGVNIQCSGGAGDNLKASALLKAALFFMPDYNDKKWDEFVSLMYEMSYLLAKMPDADVETHQ